MWSFGVVIWDTLTTVKPYGGLDSYQIFLEVSYDLISKKLISSL